METTIPLFSQDWWLDCVCGEDKWDVLLIEQNGAVEASFPFYMPVSKVITMPPLTKTMGIWFNPAFILPNYTKELLRKQRLCTAMIQQLPAFSSFLQNFHHTFTDWLPFYWAGFKQTTRYTYVLPDIRNESEVWNNFSKEMKKNIIQAQTKYKLTVKRGIDSESFIALHGYIMKGKSHTDRNFCRLRKLISLTVSKHIGDIWGAFDEDGNLHAAQFIIWHGNCAFCLAGGSNPDFRKSGGHALVLWEGIRYTSTVVSSLNFLGSMIQGIEYFNRGFSAIQTPYFSISKGKIGLLQRGVLFLKKRITE